MFEDAISSLPIAGGRMTPRQVDELADRLGVPADAALSARLERRGIRVSEAPRLPRLPAAIAADDLARAMDALECRHIVDFLIGRDRGPFRVIDGLWFENESFRTVALDRAWLLDVEETWSAAADGTRRSAAIWLLGRIHGLLADDKMGLRHVALAQIATLLNDAAERGVAPGRLDAEAERLGVHEDEAGLVAFAVVEWARTYRAGAIEELTAAWNSRELARAKRMVAAMGPERDDPEVARLVSLVRDAWREVDALVMTGHAAEVAGDDEAAAAAYWRAAQLVADLPDLRQALARCPPPAPTRLRAVADGARVRLEWAAANTSVGAIAYRVTRTEAGRPAAGREGTMMVDTAETVAVDWSPPLGTELSYRVRASRDGSTWSDRFALAEPLVLAPDLSDLRVRSRHGVVEADWTWNAADMRVKVVRVEGHMPPGPDSTDGRRWDIPAGVFVDRKVVEGRTYSYRFTAVYSSTEGREILAPGLTVTVTPEPDPQPVESLTVTPDMASRTLVVSWAGRPEGRVAILESTDEAPLGTGTIVAVSDLEAVAGVLRYPEATESQTIEVPATPGQWHFTALTFRGGNVAVGPGRQLVIEPPIEDLKPRRFRNQLLLQWIWPENTAEAVVLARAGSIPTSEFDPAARRWVVPRSQYFLEHAFRLPLSNGTHGVAVYAARTDGDERHVALPTTALIGPIGAERSVNYEILRPPRHAGTKRILRILAEDSVDEALDLNLVARPGDVLPLAADEPGCIEILRLRGVKLAPGAPRDEPFDLDGLPRPCYLRGFVVGEAASDVRLVDPARDQLIVRRSWRK